MKSNGCTGIYLIFKNIVAAFRGIHVSPAKQSYAWLPRKFDYRTDGQTDRHTDRRTDGRRTKWSLCAAMLRRRHNEEYMCRLRNIAMRDYQESVTTGQTDRQTDRQTDGQTDAGQSDPYVPLCFAGDTKRWRPFISRHVSLNILINKSDPWGSWKERPPSNCKQERVGMNTSVGENFSFFNSCCLHKPHSLTKPIQLISCVTVTYTQFSLGNYMYLLDHFSFKLYYSDLNSTFSISHYLYIYYTFYFGWKPCLT